MPRLLIELTGVEYDRLVAYAKTLRRTPQQQAAQLIADTMAVLHEHQETAAPPEGVDEALARLTTEQVRALGGHPNRSGRPDPP